MIQKRLQHQCAVYIPSTVLFGNVAVLSGNTCTYLQKSMCSLATSVHSEHSAMTTAHPTVFHTPVRVPRICSAHHVISFRRLSDASFKNKYLVKTQPLTAHNDQRFMYVVLYLMQSNYLITCLIQFFKKPQTI